MTRLELTPEERAVMCHAIGLKSPHTGCETQNIGWRNRYVCDPSEVWSGLVDRDLPRVTTTLGGLLGYGRATDLLAYATWMVEVEKVLKEHHES